MNRSFVLLVLLVSLVFTIGVLAQDPSAGVAGGMMPAVGSPTPQAGCFVYPGTHSAGQVRTNYVMFSKDCSKPLVQSAPTAITTAASTVGPMAVITYQSPEVPASLGCLYAKNPSYSGCWPYDSAGNIKLGGPSYMGYGAIAIVDAYDNPYASYDLSYFDSYWGIPAPPSFTKVYANGNGSCTTPPPSAGWSVESSMDIEYAHAFAPKAAIVLVEACSNSWSDMFYAEQVAFNYLMTNFKTQGGQVSNSWGGPESSSFLVYDTYFRDSYPYNGYSNNTHVQAFVSSGDCGYMNNNCSGITGTNNYPSTVPWVVSAGGTSILRYTTGAGLKNMFYKEACWNGAGGGTSATESYQTTFVNNGSNMGPWANYQAPMFGYAVNGSFRATPDISFNADPASGAWVYSYYGMGGWGVVGGTSLSAPALAGLVNRAGNKLSTWAPMSPTGSTWYTARENNLLYSYMESATMYKANFYDVTTGSNGAAAKAGWDYCTGIGSPRGIVGK